jgi:hypothetical protein
MFLFSSLSLDNLKSCNDFYFIPVDYAGDFFRIHYANSVKDISKFECSEKVFALQKEIISKINPAENFTFSVTISIKDKSYKCSVWPLGKILTDKSIGYSEYLTCGFLTGGEKSIDFGKEILIIPGMISVQKFDDAEVLSKLNKALNETFWNASHSSQFELENKESEVKLTVNIGLSHDADMMLKENMVGPFKLPDIPKVGKVSDSTDLLIKTVVPE